MKLIKENKKIVASLIGVVVLTVGGVSASKIQQEMGSHELVGDRIVAVDIIDEDIEKPVIDIKESRGDKKDVAEESGKVQEEVVEEPEVPVIKEETNNVIAKKENEINKLIEDYEEKVEKEKEEALEKKRKQREQLAMEDVSRGSTPIRSNDSSFNRYAMYDIPMPVEHQRYLYDLCKANNLDYIKTLAILKHESQFKADNVSSTNDYGYMQINTVNHKNFAETLGTPNTPLDPYVNLQWGVHSLSTLKGGFEAQGLSGRELFESVQSAYNKGVAGFRRHGKAVRYIQRTDNELQWLKDKLNL